jgi:signal transduction histidine kinase
LIQDSGPDGFALATRIAAATAHDLNNVAAVVGGHLYLLKQGAEPPDEAFGDMETALETLARLTRSLQALASIGRGEPGPCNVNEIVREARQTIAAELELDGDLPSLVGRRRDLLCAIEALYSNAREASPPGAPIRVSTTRLPGDTGIQITIEDRGPGVPPELRTRVFDPLFSTRGARGRGSGLTLAAMVAAMHGGSCELETREGGGTRAVLRLRRGLPDQS